MPRAPSSWARKPYDRSRSSDGKWVHDKAPVGVPRAVVNAGSGPKGPPSNKLVVSNLHYEVMPKDLTSIFGQIGTLVREPDIKYDRSGRSTGVAIITYETPMEATRAKNQFNKILAKGQPMEIAYYTRPARRASGDPRSLLNRISKPPLIKRLVPEESVTRDTEFETVRATTNGGPIRTRGGRRGGRAKGEKFRKEPKTADELDKELDMIMGQGDSSSSAPPVATSSDFDVEMAA